MKTLLTCVGALMAAAAFAEEPSGVRYFSNSGNDAQDGLTPQTAWRSLEKLEKDLPAGGEARLRRGDVFYGQVRLKPGLSDKKRTTVSAYGEGAAPEVRAYKIARNDASVWASAGTNNLWRFNFNDATAYTGNKMTADGNIGFIRVDGKIFGRKFFAKLKKPLTQQWDFQDDNGFVTVYSVKNPAELAKEIAFAPNMGVIPFKDHMELRDIVVRGTGGHGSNGVGRDIRIVNCGFHEIGGSCLRGYGQGTTRYGNGVECWAGSTDIQVSGCAFSEIYDVGFTMQGGYPPRSWADIHVTDSTFTRCTQAYELWAGKCRKGIGMTRCSFQRNRCIDTARGWAYDVRPDKTNATPLLMYGMETDLCEIIVRGNVFIGTRNFQIFKSGGIANLPETYIIEGNTFVGDKNAPIAYTVGGKKAEAEAARIAKIRKNNKFVSE